MYIEEIIETVALRIMNDFMASLAMRIDDDLALTTRQGHAALSFLRNHESDIEKYIPKISQYLENPVWEKTLIPSLDVKAEARLVGGNVIALRKSTNPRYRELLKSAHAIYNNGLNAVIVQDAQTRDRVIQLLGSEGFAIDGELEEYLSGTLDISGDPEIFYYDDKIMMTVPNDNVFADFCSQVLGMNDE